MSSSPLYRPDPFTQPFFPTASTEPPRAARPSGRRPIWIYAAVLGVFLGSTAYLVGPSAIGMYYASTGLEAYAARDEEKAISQLDAAVRWQPDSLQIRATRCRLLARGGQIEKAKEDLAAVTAQLGALRKENLTRMQHSVVAQMHQECGEYRQALAAMKEAVAKPEGELTNFGKALDLNNLAYFAALAVAYEPTSDDADAKLLEEMLASAEQALRLAPGESSLLDTRGFLHYLRGDASAAIADFDKAIAATDALLQAGRKQMKENSRQAYQFQIQLRELEYSAAVMYQHRMKAHQKAGDEALAQKDREQIVQLGFNPELPLN